MFIAFEAVAVLFALILLGRAINLIVLMRWYAHPKSPGSAISVGGRRVFYTLMGAGSPTVVIEAGLGTGSPEWWTLQEELAKTTGVLTYDRAGYGWSEPVLEPRASELIASELKQLLDHLEIDGPLVLVGHSQGGLYANHFCRFFPNLVAGALFIDPVSPDNIRFKQELTPRVYQRSGVDKARTLKFQSWLNGFGFTRLMKPWIVKSKPFIPYTHLPKATLRILWNYMLLPHAPRTALSEYRESLDPLNSSALKGLNTFPSVPVKVIAHSPAKMKQMLMERGRLQPEEAERVEELWQALIWSYSDLSPESSLTVATESGHNPHLEQQDLVVQSILEIVAASRRS
jgi:pimeloyl-ACP methyl ester carboxylesterase